jgi:hypothetical protein
MNADPTTIIQDIVSSAASIEAAYIALVQRVKDADLALSDACEDTAEAHNAMRVYANQPVIDGTLEEIRSIVAETKTAADRFLAACEEEERARLVADTTREERVQVERLYQAAWVLAQMQGDHSTIPTPPLA